MFNNMLEENEQKDIVNQFDSIESLGNKIGLKNIIKKVLSDLNYKEIANNEVIVHRLTINYFNDSDYGIRSIHDDFEYMINRVDDLTDSLYSEVYDYIKNNYEYEVSNKCAKLERKRVSFNNKAFTKFSDNYLFYIKYQVLNKIAGVELHIDLMTYDSNTDTTKIVSNDIFSYIPRPYDYECNDLYCTSEFTSNEYDKNGMMIRLTSMKHEDALDMSQVNKYNVQDFELEHLFVSDKNYYSLTELRKIDDKNASFLNREKIDNGYCEVKDIVPVVYNSELINYFTGMVDNDVNIGDLEVTNLRNFELRSYYNFLENLGLDRMSFDESFNKTLNDRHKNISNDIYSCIYSFDYYKMMPHDLDERKIRTKGYTNF